MSTPASQPSTKLEARGELGSKERYIRQSARENNDKQPQLLAATKGAVPLRHARLQFAKPNPVKLPYP